MILRGRGKLQAAPDGRLASAFEKVREASAQYGFMMFYVRAWCEEDNLIHDATCFPVSKTNCANPMLLGQVFEFRVLRVFRVLLYGLIILTSSNLLLLHPSSCVLTISSVGSFDF